MVTYKPMVRGSFSDRNGIKKINDTIQKESLDNRTRNRIINFFDSILKYVEQNIGISKMYNYIYKHIFCLTNDEIPCFNNDKRKMIVTGIKNEWNYDEIFSFLEEFCLWIKRNCLLSDDIYSTINDIFNEECVGYRFIDGKISDIIDDIEIQEIENALNNNYETCKKSIRKALEFLYDREKPDYQNSVKESISAVEGICNIINGKKDTLGNALKKLEKNGYKIHKALYDGFNSIYGYTSDQSGIRHNGGIDENTTFEEAKYMLVSCSAFVNYLISVYEKNKDK